ncbi:MAG: UvrB/UvrC motif-containing protein, partial [Planctomycetes bacterium]|nr:UvrB/UvrC motif-containing protein [Planctomycetota bacterium]
LDPIRADGEDCPEIQVLQTLRAELIEAMPADAEPRLQRELEEALECEDYERAANLRDQIRRTHDDAA